MTSAEDAADRMVQAALALAAEVGWRDLSLVDIARRAEVPLPDAYRVAPSKGVLLLRLMCATDQTVLSGGMADPAETPRDRLFEILMRRFDAMQAHRAGTLAILRELPADPFSALLTLPQFAISLAWTLEAAGLSASGLRGVLRVKALGLVYLSALRAWVQDESADLSSTMAALDKGLRRLEQVVRRLPSPLRGRTDAADESFAAPPPPPPPPPSPAAPPPDTGQDRPGSA
jgi:AcrR family transcriptional regulator